MIGFRDSLFRTRPARDWIFEGISDSLLTMGSFFVQVSFHERHSSTIKIFKKEEIVCAKIP